MAQIEILGQELPVDRSRLPLLVGVGALVIGLFFFRRPAASPPADGSFDAGAAAEFARVSSEAAGDARRLTEATNLRRYELDLAARNTPAGLRECITGEQWRQMPRESRNLIRNQAKRGGAAVTPGPGGGVCVVPTGRGIEGDLMAVQRARGGFFSSSSRGIGAPAPPVPRTGVQSWFDMQLAAFEAALAASGAGYA